MNNTTTSTLLTYYNPMVEDDLTTEEHEEEYNKGSFALKVLYGVVLSLAFYRLMDSEVNVEFKFSVSKSKNKS